MKTLPSIDNNQFKIGYDFPGLCALCHIEIAEFHGSLPNGRPNVTKMKGNASSLKVKLDDGSVMGVNICNDCYNDFKPEDMKDLMESVINGWQSEVDILPWEEEKKISYMKEYSKLKAIGRKDVNYSAEQLAKIKDPDLNKLNIKVGK